MHIETLVRIEDGKKLQGFLDWDPMERKVNFYYFDEDKMGWVSEKLGKFRPLPLPEEKKVIGE